MFDLAPIGITTDGSGGAHHPEQQKHDGCRKGRHDDVWERAKSVFGDVMDLYVCVRSLGLWTEFVVCYGLDVKQRDSVSNIYRGIRMYAFDVRCL